MDLLSGLDIVRREPASDAFVPQIRMQAVGEFLIFGGIADEAGIELKGLPGDNACRGGRHFCIYFWYTVGRGPFSSVSRSQIMPSRE